jgi:hypothetical protein
MDNETINKISSIFNLKDRENIAEQIF